VAGQAERWSPQLLLAERQAERWQFELLPADRQIRRREPGSDDPGGAVVARAVRVDGQGERRGPGPDDPGGAVVAGAAPMDGQGASLDRQIQAERWRGG